MRPVALAKKPKIRKKKDSGKLAICPDTHVTVPKSKFACRVVSGVWFYISSFIKIGSVVLPLWVVEIAIPHYFGLYNSLYYRTSRDDICHVAKMSHLILFADNTNIFVADHNLNNLICNINYELQLISEWF